MSSILGFELAGITLLLGTLAWPRENTLGNVISWCLAGLTLMLCAVYIAAQTVLFVNPNELVASNMWPTLMLWLHLH